MNSFQRFGIDHLSPSSLLLYRANAGLWAVQYIAKRKDNGNPAMLAGTAVEHGVDALLRGADLPHAKARALNTFDDNIKTGEGWDADSIKDGRARIEPMLATSATWTPPGPLNAWQLKVEFWFDKIPIPIIGWLDFGFDGVDIDLKTTLKCPSEPRPDHVKQVALYRAARGRAGGILYVTPKRHAYYEVDDQMMTDALVDLEAAAFSISNLLARMDGPDDVIKCLYGSIDWDHFRAPKTRVPLADILLAG